MTAGWLVALGAYALLAPLGARVALGVLDVTSASCRERWGPAAAVLVALALGACAPMGEAPTTFTSSLGLLGPPPAYPYGSHAAEAYARNVPTITYGAPAYGAFPSFDPSWGMGGPAW